MSLKELGSGTRKPGRAPAALLLSASALGACALLLLLLLGATAPTGRRASAQLWSNVSPPPRARAA